MPVEKAAAKQEIGESKPAEIVRNPINKSAKPLASKSGASSISIESFLTKKNEQKQEVAGNVPAEKLPTDHFSETALAEEWAKFLENLRVKDAVVYNAVHNFKISKTDEDTVTVRYPSESSRAEFEKIRAEFFGHFQHKVNHFGIKINYIRDEIGLKKEMVTKRSIFEKLAQINPLLKELDDVMKFDFS